MNTAMKIVPPYASMEVVKGFRDQDRLILEESSPAYGSRYMDLREDFVFKHIFGKESNKSLLIDLVNSLSEGRRQICDLCYGSVERQGAMKGTRKTVFDIQCTSDRGEQFLIEMQRDHEKSWLYEAAGFVLSEPFISRTTSTNRIQ